MQDIRAQLEVIDQPGLLPALAESDLGGGGQPISAFSPDQRLAAEQNLRNLTSLSSLAALQVRSIEFELPKSTAEQENSVSRNMSRIADATSLSPYKDVVRIVVTRDIRRPTRRRTPISASTTSYRYARGRRRRRR